MMMEKEIVYKEYIITLDEAKQIKLKVLAIQESLFSALISNSTFRSEKEFPKGLKVFLKLREDGKTISKSYLFVDKDGVHQLWSNSIRTTMNGNKKYRIITKKFSKK